MFSNIDDKENDDQEEYKWSFNQCEDNNHDLCVENVKYLRSEEQIRADREVSREWEEKGWYRQTYLRIIYIFQPFINY